MQRHPFYAETAPHFRARKETLFSFRWWRTRSRTALTMLRYEQRFNVAVSRARDRVVLVRSVRREDRRARLLHGAAKLDRLARNEIGTCHRTKHTAASAHAPTDRADGRCRSDSLPH
jgi:hypothetical protein